MFSGWPAAVLLLTAVTAAVDAAPAADPQQPAAPGDLLGNLLAPVKAGFENLEMLGKAAGDAVIDFANAVLPHNNKKVEVNRVNHGGGGGANQVAPSLNHNDGQQASCLGDCGPNTPIEQHGPNSISGANNGQRVPDIPISRGPASIPLMPAGHSGGGEWIPSENSNQNGPDSIPLVPAGNSDGGVWIPSDSGGDPGRPITGVDGGDGDDGGTELEGDGGDDDDTPAGDREESGRPDGSDDNVVPEEGGQEESEGNGGGNRNQNWDSEGGQPGDGDGNINISGNGGGKDGNSIVSGNGNHGGQSSNIEISTGRSPQPVRPQSQGRCGYVEDKNIEQGLATIVGGVASTPGRWPWAAALGEPQDDGNFQVLCGGTLIAWDTVLTAAHCFPAGTNWVSTVRVGDTDVGSSKDGNGEDLPIASRIFHPGWDSTALKNDICILKLERSARESSLVQLACLPYAYRGQNLVSLLSQDEPTIIGWGATKSGGYVVDNLQETQVPLVTNDECQAKYQAVSDAVIEGTKLCAGNGVNDTCQGDSGGPMLTNAVAGVWTIVGVTSFGIGCGGDTPGVYTRVDMYLDWIQENL